jgi:peptidoglycan/LPS O-acetylase OafA/YrhL
MIYRPEIDGLRALAVIPVIFYHAGFSAFSGGFVGVDIFFVISGYLISTIIFAEKKTGNFSLLNFYERRARRILPALFVVMLSCMLCALFWLLPSDMKSFSESLVSVSLSASNIFFYLTSSYFDITSELKPLIHTWSLAVEEQYYVLFPIFVILTWRLGSLWNITLLIFLFLISLIVAQWESRQIPEAGFYLLPARAWELLLGVLLANYSDIKCNSSHRRVVLLEVASIIGFVLIISSVFLFDKQTPFPSLYTLVPTVGGAMIILFATQKTFVGRFLSNKIFVGIGLISYSLYLWHQPIFSFIRYRSLAEPNAVTFILLIFIAFILAFITWKYVEKPFRNKQKFNCKQILIYGVIGSALFITIGLFGYFSNGFSLRQAPKYLPNNYFAMAAISPVKKVGIDGKLCISESASICKLSSVSGAKKILLVGDSHSADYSIEFRKYVNNKKISGSQLSVGGCGFISSQSGRHNGECGKAVQLLLSTVSNEWFDKIIFIGNFYGHTGKSDQLTLTNDMDSLSNLIQKLLNTGSELIFFTPRNSLSSDPMRAAFFNQLREVHIVHESSEVYVDEILSGFEKYPNFRIYNERDYLIELGGMREFNGHTTDLVPLYRDTHHLTNYAAKVSFNRLVLMSDL